MKQQANIVLRQKKFTPILTVLINIQGKQRTLFIRRTVYRDVLLFYSIIRGIIMAVSKKKPVPTEQQHITQEVELAMAGTSGRESWLEECAYYMSEARGFISGYEQGDWSAAEQKYKEIIPT